MAFIKKCVGEIKLCFSCGKAAILLYSGQWYCPDCLHLDRNDTKKEEALKSELN